MKRQINVRPAGNLNQGFLFGKKSSPHNFRLLQQSARSVADQRGQFAVALGGIAEVQWKVTFGNSAALDPSQTSAGSKSRIATNPD
jgi:hypothetical protein